MMQFQGIFLIFISLLINNFFINQHIYHFCTVYDKIESDSLFIRLIVLIWSIVICIIKKQFAKVKDIFCLVNLGVLKNYFSVKRIMLIKNVKYKILYGIFWLMIFVFIILIVLNILKIERIDETTKNILFIQMLFWFIESFLLLRSGK